MIKTVTVTNYLGESLTLELSNPFDIGINVRSIEGIGPPKGNVNYTEIASGDGGQFNSARASIRNITMQLGLMPVPTVEESRHRVYKYFPLDQQVTLRFETDKRLCEITGWVEECEPDIFSDDETIDISIVCPDPYFYSVDSQLGTINFSGVVDEFEFPFENSPDNESKIAVMAMAASANSSQEMMLEDYLQTGIVDDHNYITSHGWYAVAAIEISNASSVEIRWGASFLSMTYNFYIFKCPVSQSATEDTLQYAATVKEYWDTSTFSIDVSDYSQSGMKLYLVVEVENTLSYAKENAVEITLNTSGSPDPDPDPDPDPEPDPDPDPEPGEDNGFPDPPGDYPLYPVEVDQADTTNQYIEFASLVYRQEENIPYDGDVPTGVVMRLHATGEVRNITIYNMDTRERIVIRTDRIKAITGHDFNTGDDIIITTTRGSKSIEYVHEGISYNILNALEKDTDWFMLSKGDNVFAYICEYGTEDLQFRLEYPTLYWGI